jgi:hypothetical protein
VSLNPLARVNFSSVQPGAVQVAPCQPSPHESHSASVQLPGGTACIAE